MAPKGQVPQQAPHLMHLVVSMVWGMRIWPSMASMGHCYHTAYYGEVLAAYIIED